MNITDTKIPAVKLIEPTVFEDRRGYFFESYRKSLLHEAGITADFVQDNISKSYQNTVRGLHYQIQQPQAKLVQCIKGAILDVAVDIRVDSPTFGKHVAFELSEENKRMLFVPVGFAHGFSVLSDEAIFAYKCSDYYCKEGERGIRWDDLEIEINWSVEKPILSDKDQKLPLLSSIKKEDLF